MRDWFFYLLACAFQGGHSLLDKLFYLSRPTVEIVSQLFKPVSKSIFPTGKTIYLWTCASFWMRILPKCRVKECSQFCVQDDFTLVCLMFLFLHAQFYDINWTWGGKGDNRWQTRIWFHGGFWPVVTMMIVIIREVNDQHSEGFVEGPLHWYWFTVLRYGIQ